MSEAATPERIHGAPDGYTILVCASANTINATLYKRLAFDFARDLVPIAGLVLVPNLIAVHPSVPVRTVAEFIAHAKANPGKINMGSSGNGTTPHLAGELFKAMTGVDLVHVPYRGSAPSMTGLLAGDVQVSFMDITTALPHIRSGAVRALAITTKTRNDALPDLPSVADTVPGYETMAWFGFVVPKNTPADVIEKLNREINAALSDATIKARLAELGTTPLVFTPAQFGAFIAAEIENWGRAVKYSGASVN